MRAITPLAIPDLTPADLTGQAQPDFDRADPREPSRGSKFKPPICGRVESKLDILDVQHTAAACASRRPTA